MNRNHEDILICQNFYITKTCCVGSIVRTPKNMGKYLLDDEIKQIFTLSIAISFLRK